jgi:Uma2 family endonuclease
VRGCGALWQQPSGAGRDGLSPTTRRTDVSQKLADYFKLPTVQHYLILFADRVQAIHHRRVGDRIETRVLTDGDVTLDPPGIVLPLGGFYPVVGAGVMR